MNLFENTIFRKLHLLLESASYFRLKFHRIDYMLVKVYYVTWFKNVIASEAKQSLYHQEIASSLRSSQ